MAECGRVKIADLGVCNEFMGEDASMNNGAIAGTPAFRSPETLLKGQVNFHHFNPNNIYNKAFQTETLYFDGHVHIEMLILMPYTPLWLNYSV